MVRNTELLLSKSLHLAYNVRVEIVRAFACSMTAETYDSPACCDDCIAVAIYDGEVTLLRKLLGVTECDVVKAVKSDRVGF